MSPAVRLVSEVGGVGRLPSAPGTWASLAAIPAAWALHALGGFPLFALATVAAFGAGMWAVAAYLAEGAGGLDPDAAETELVNGRREPRPGKVGDPSEVVIDEVVGMWIALWPLSLGLWLQDMPGGVFPWPGWVLGFLLFRFFDIRKPPPIGRVERIPGALGVMLDDVVAGVLAALVAAAMAVVAHGVLM